jgi:hypothetical protein
MNIENDVRSDIFWTSNPRILISTDRLMEFWPNQSMSDFEKLNAIARFSIYAGILLLIYQGETWPLYIPVIGLALTMFLSKTIANKQEDMQSEENKELSEDRIYNEFNPLDADDDYTKDPGLNYEQRLKKTIEDEYYQKNMRGKSKEIVLDGEQCTAPTRDNPFMNVTVNQYSDNPQRSAACNPQKVSADIEQNFNHDLYKDAGDIFSKENYQRQFYTMPSTTNPNKQGDYARWLYGTPLGSTCKEDSQNCYISRDGQNDVRQQSRNSGFDPAKLIKSGFP